MKNHVFSSSGYELGSSEFYDYISYLFTMNHLSRDNFLGFRRYLSEYIPKDKYGALVWMSSVSNDQISGDLNGNVPTFEKHFQSNSLGEIFSPWLNPKIKADVTKKDESVDWSSAYVKSEGDSYMLLQGFSGFFSEKYRSDSNQMPKPVFEAVFNKFSKSTPLGTKNYFSKSNSVSGSGFGLYMGNRGKGDKGRKERAKVKRV